MEKPIEEFVTDGKLKETVKQIGASLHGLTYAQAVEVIGIVRAELSRYTLVITDTKKGDLTSADKCL